MNVCFVLSLIIFIYMSMDLLLPWVLDSTFILDSEGVLQDLDLSLDPKSQDLDRSFVLGSTFEARVVPLTL